MRIRSFAHCVPKQEFGNKSATQPTATAALPQARDRRSRCRETKKRLATAARRSSMGKSWCQKENEAAGPTTRQHRPALRLRGRDRHEAKRLTPADDRPAVRGPAASELGSPLVFVHRPDAASAENLRRKMCFLRE